MVLKYIYRLSAVLVLLASFCATLNAEFPDVKVKIINNSSQQVKYLIDNFKYLDDQRNWKLLPSNSLILENIRHTTKWGYLELQIINSNDQKIYSYKPSGTNPEVTIFIQNTDKPHELEIIRKRGLQE